MERGGSKPNAGVGATDKGLVACGFFTLCPGVRDRGGGTIGERPGGSDGGVSKRFVKRGRDFEVLISWNDAVCMLF